jgi:histidinol-phosphate aminotransferase
MSDPRADVQSMHAYAVQDSAGLLKLDAMENPTACRPTCRRAGPAPGRVALNRYPGARVDDLRAALARLRGLPEGWT